MPRMKCAGSGSSCGGSPPTKTTGARSDRRRSSCPSPKVSRPGGTSFRPHDDVATGNFQASEFAADLYKVAVASEDAGGDYADPVEFFSRTYLTEGLRDLIGRAVRRLAGDENASPGDQPADELRRRQDPLDAGVPPRLGIAESSPTHSPWWIRAEVLGEMAVELRPDAADRLVQQDGKCGKGACGYQ